MQNSKYHIAVVVIALVLTLEGGAQGEEKIKMPQYLFPEFSECRVLLRDNQIVPQVLNYNTITEKMVYMKEGRYYDMMNPSQIDTVYFNDSKFIPENKMFYEVVMTGPVSLFIQHKSGMVTTGKPIGYGGTSQGVSSYYLSKHELSPEYINIQVPPDVTVNPEPVYWIRMNDEMKSFKNEKEFGEIFPDKLKEIRSFIRENRIKIENRDNLIELFHFATGL